MPDKVYEVIAQGARYWFLFLMVLIVWRSWRWYRKDRRAARKRLKLLPDAGFVGEMVVMDGGGVLDRGEVFPVPREGTLGFLRTNDLCVPARGVEGRHLWFRFDDRKGLMIQTFSKNQAKADGENLQPRKPVYMAHGSWLTVGDVQLRLRLFAGFESISRAQRRPVFVPDDPQEQPEQNDQPAQQGMTQEQYQQMLWQQWQMQQYAQQAYEQGYRQAMAQQAYEEPAYEEPVYEEEPAPEEPYGEWAYGDDPGELPYDMAQIAREEGMVDNTIFMRPAGQSRPQIPQEELSEERFAPETAFYPPDMDGYDPAGEPENWHGDADEDMTDAAAPPRSAYIGHDEAARAKREIWDKYFGGGTRQ